MKRARVPSITKLLALVVASYASKSIFTLNFLEKSSHSRIQIYFYVLLETQIERVTHVKNIN